MATRILSSRTRPRKARAPYPFVVKIDGARTVSVTGDFIGWSAEGLPLHQIRSGEWAVNLALEPGDYQYRLKVDGDWRDHPEAVRRVPNPFGGENGVLTVT